VINIRKYFVVMCFVLAGMCKTSFSMNCFAKFKAKRLEMEAQAKKIHPLFYAIHQDADLKVIEFLLKNGLQKHINGCYGDKKTPLILACEKNNLEMTKLFLRYGAHTVVKDKNEDTPLHFACKNNNLPMAKLVFQSFLGFGGQMPWDKLGDRNISPLAWACYNKNVQMVEFLLKHLNCEYWKRRRDEHYGWNPLEIACKRKSPKIVKLLLAEGVILTDKSVDFAFEGKQWEILQSLFSLENERLEQLRLCLFFACYRGNDEMVKSLLEEEGCKKYVCDVNSKGETPLFLACKKYNVQTVKLLLENGAKESVNVVDKSGTTPLSVACYCDDAFEIPKLLLENGAQKSINLGDDCAPLCLASEHYNFELIKLLLAYGAGDEDLIGYGFMLAYTRGRWDIVKYFLKIGLVKDANCTWRCGGAPALWFACADPNVEIEVIKLLLAKGARSIINVMQGSSTTPLAEACIYGSIEVVKLLVENGAEISDDIIAQANSQAKRNLLQLVVQYRGAVNKAAFIENLAARGIEEESREGVGVAFFLARLFFLHASENKIELIKTQRAEGRNLLAQILMTRLFLHSIEQIMNKKKNIESTLFAKMYTPANATFLQKALGVASYSFGDNVWEYAKAVLKKNNFKRKDIKEYDFQKKLQSMKKRKKFSVLGIILGNENSDNTTGKKRKRSERLEDNKRRKTE